MNALRALLSGVIDYAGLFPPAALPMREAVARYAAGRTGPHAWLIGRFVVPAARLVEFESALSAVSLPAPGTFPWRLSALVGDDARADAATIASFNARQSALAPAPRAIVDACEVKVTAPGEVAHLAGVLPPGLAVAYEIAAASPNRREIVAAVRSVSGIAKIRTGGTVARAIPSVDIVAVFILDCVDQGVPFKATAGLHHPVRAVHPLTYDADSHSAAMHGFLNVLTAAAVAATRGDVVTAVLEEREPEAFRFDDDALWWRGVRLTTAELTRARATVALSFGSCSVDEPIADLRRLGYSLAQPPPSTSP